MQEAGFVPPRNTAMLIGPKTWMIAQTKTVTRDKEGTVELGRHLGWLTLVDREGRDAIPVFTTEEKATDYIQATNDEPRATVVPIRNLGVLIDVLEHVLKVGFAEALVLDPVGKISQGHQRALHEFLTDLRSNMRRQ
jgi:hypothetical protein